MQPQQPHDLTQPPVSPAPQPYHAALHQPQHNAVPGYPPTYGPQPVAVVAAAPSSGTAVASMILGILGAVGGWCMLAIPCLIAVVLGHAALSDIKRTGKSGKGMAVAGLVLGYVFGFPWAVMAVMMLMGAISAPFMPDTSATTGP